MIDLKIPEGFKVKDFDFPLDGEYILMTNGEYLQVSPEDQAFNYPGIILEKEWEPDEGSLYEFSDDENFTFSMFRKFYGYVDPFDPHNYKFRDTEESYWKYMRPISGKLGK